MKDIMKIDSIIFDLDGTLWDSTEAFEVFFNKALIGKVNLQKTVTGEDIKRAFGLQIDEFISCILPYLDSESHKKVVGIFDKTYCNYVNKYGGKPYKNMKETIKSLSKKYSLFIVSNCQRGYIETFLEETELEAYFKGRECSGNTGLLKKDNIKLIVDRYALKNPVYIGDTQLDCDSAEGAGVPFIFASYGFGSVRNYNYILDDISDLNEIEKM